MCTHTHTHMYTHASRQSTSVHISHWTTEFCAIRVHDGSEGWYWTDSAMISVVSDDYRMMAHIFKLFTASLWDNHLGSGQKIQEHSNVHKT